MKHRPASIAAALASIAIPSVLAVASPSASAQAAPQTATAPNGLFSQMVVFGDSFSDSGNFSTAVGYPQTTRFTTNPGLVAVEYFANYFHMPIKASLQGGSNYAFALASVRESSPDTPDFVPSLPDQLAMSLAASGGKADPNALYTIVGGANDVFANFTGVGNGDITPEQALANLKADAQAELGMIRQLDQAGARYVMVFNLPDLGLSPDVAAMGPDVAGMLTQMTTAYNDVLSAGLSQTTINVIPVNLLALFDEIASDPARYGLTSVAEPACGMDALSIDCGPEGSGAPYTYAAGAENTHLFADFGHPGTATHKMLAQYAQYIVLAPGQISLLGEAPLAFNAGIDRAVLMRALSRSSHPGEGWRPWLNVSHARQRFDAQLDSPANRSDTSLLGVGADIQATATVTAGFALSTGRQRNTFAGNAGGFRLDAGEATGHALWHGAHAYIGAIGSVGHLRYRNVERTIQIGPDQRHETGDTSGSHTALSLAGGWWFDAGDWKTGPFADLGWQRIRVDGYREAGNDATAMWFGSQRRNALIASLGWQFSGVLHSGDRTLYPYARLAWHHDRNAEPRAVSAGLNSMAGTFALDGYMPDRDWVSAELGLGCDFAPNLSGWIGYSGRLADGSQRMDSLNLGAKFRF